MVKLLIAILRTARPLQWLKNLAVFAPLLFSGFLFELQKDNTPYAVTVALTFAIFCILTSTTYFINDIFDIKKDQAHPFKKKRPLAHGDLPVWLAWVLAGAGLIAVGFLSMQLPSFFRMLCLGYVALQLIYTLWFKHIAIFDVLSIAAFFLIRIYAGAAVVNVRMNSWFLLTVIAASLFLAVGKRRSELTLLQNQQTKLDTRASFKKYNEQLLNQYISMFATATWLSWALFTFQFQFGQTTKKLFFVYKNVPTILFSEKLLMITIPLVIFGVMRYLQVIYEGRGESPERVLISDKVLIGIVALTMLLIIVVMYAPVLFSVDSWPFKWT
jgi:4-hydroxybenzoate polyprenyltransferase